MNFGITGATGHLGRLIIRNLKIKIPAGNLIALVRSPEKAKDLGLEARYFDYEKTETLGIGLNGVEGLLLISANDLANRDKKHINVIEAAQKAGVKWIVYTSLLHADTSALDLADSHLTTETFLKKSGIPYTILRNGWYTENYAGSVLGGVKTGSFYGCANDGKISSAARADYADAAVAVVSEGVVHEGKTYELAGDNSYTMNGLAAEISHQALKNVKYINISEDEYCEQLKKIGVPEAIAKAVAGWDTATAKGALFDDSHVLSKLIGRATTPISETINQTLKVK